MSKRSLEILNMIVKEYVHSAVPVGSKKLIEKYDLKYSPALIRNEMSDLEKEGYLAKKHTSGGRIPTNKAYKYYSENSHLEDVKVTERNVSKYIDKIFNKRETTIEDIVNQTLKVLSKATNLVAMATQTVDKEESLANISLHQTQKSSAVMVIVTNKNRVINSVIELPANFDINNLITSIEIFNERLNGTILAEIESKALLLKNIIFEKIKDIEFDFKSFVKLMFKNLSLKTNIKHGVGTIAHYDEIHSRKDVFEKMLKIIDENSVWDIIKSNSKDNSSNIIIGWEESEDLTIINKDINIKGKKHSVALIGPTRIDYEKISTILKIVTKKVENL